MRRVFFGMAVRLAVRLVLVLRQQRLEAGVVAEEMRPCVGHSNPMFFSSAMNRGSDRSPSKAGNVPSSV